MGARGAARADGRASVSQSVVGIALRVYQAWSEPIGWVKALEKFGSWKR